MGIEAMMVMPETLHPGPVVQKKRPPAPGRAAANARRRKESKGRPADDALSKLYEWFVAHGRSLESAPAKLLEQTRSHIGERVTTLKAMRDKVRAKGERTSRIDAQLRWLSRWLALAGGPR